MQNIQEVKDFLSMLPGGVFCVSVDGDLVYCNDAVWELYGCTGLAELRAFSENNFWNLIHPDDRPALKTLFRSAQQEEVRAEYRVIRKDQGIRWVFSAVRLTACHDGSMLVYGFQLDVTANKNRRGQESQGDERLRVLAEINNDIIFDLDCQTGHTVLYGDFEKRFGRSPQLSDFQSDPYAPMSQVPELVVDTQSGFSGKGDHVEKIQRDVQLPTGDGRTAWCRYQVGVLRDSEGKPLRHIGCLLDIQDIKAKEEALRRRAQHDLLTDVYNRETVQEMIAYCLREREISPQVLMIIDLDDFKHINDTYGHPAGDKVLCHLAKTLSKAFRIGDIIGRLGGDEFMVFLNRVKSLEKVYQRATSLCTDAFNDFDKRVINGESVTFSIGAACSMNTNCTFAEFYDCADKALYEAKRRGKGIACFHDLQK